MADKLLDFEEFQRMYVAHLEIADKHINMIQMNGYADELSKQEKRAELRTQREFMRTLVQSKRVSRLNLIQATIKGIKHYPITKNYALSFLEQVGKGDVNLIGNYTELLWFVQDAGLLAEPKSVSWMFDNTKTMIAICGRDLTRHYLNYTIMTSHRDQVNIIIPSYYYTGHDMDSFQLVRSLVSPKHLERFYNNVRVSLVERENFTLDDVDMLIEFFSAGLENPNVNIKQDAQKALTILLPG
ncbi:MAG: hypothetical protein AAFR81_01915 [Chloroflexota bacterium]